MLGFEMASDMPVFRGTGKAPSLQMVNRLHQAGVLTIPAGLHVVRLLPALNLRQAEAEEGLNIIESVMAKLA